VSFVSQSAEILRTLWLAFIGSLKRILLARSTGALTARTVPLEMSIASEMATTRLKPEKNAPQNQQHPLDLLDRLNLLGQRAAALKLSQHQS